MAWRHEPATKDFLEGIGVGFVLGMALAYLVLIIHS
jgi:hypothetical protein